MTMTMTMTTTIESSSGPGRPVALVTGVGRTIGIGAGIAARLAASGWDIAFTYWTAYDERMPWGTEPGAAGAIERSLSGHGAAVAAIEADPARVDAVGEAISADDRRRRRRAQNALAADRPGVYQLPAATPAGLQEIPAGSRWLPVRASGAAE
jgi:NAD(P)-dependent dehydrogenase (short-subunit alcohol dehydrogenase family)